MSIFKKLAGLMGGETCEAPLQKPGRNEPCWCGSGKKYKKCHYNDDQAKSFAKNSCCTGST